MIWKIVGYGMVIVGGFCIGLISDGITEGILSLVGIIGLLGGLGIVIWETNWR